MKRISFKYYMALQARFICMKSHELHKSRLEVASTYADDIRKKIKKKYVIVVS